eukprot:901036-Pleurochrysis_carterae.AAC.1
MPALISNLPRCAYHDSRHAATQMRRHTQKRTRPHARECGAARAHTPRPERLKRRRDSDCSWRKHKGNDNWGRGLSGEQR